MSTDAARAEEPAAAPGEPRRILFLAPDGTVHATRWARFMRDLGHDVRMASLHRVDLDAPFGGEPLTEPMLKGATPPRVLPGALRRVRSIARAFRPDVTLTYYLSSYGVLGALAGLRPSVAATAGGDVLEYTDDTFVRRVKNGLVFKVVLPRTDRFLAWAPHVADRLVSLGVAREKILVLPRGVNLDAFAFRPPRRRAPGDPLRILSMRMLKPLYSVETLVEALVLLDAAGVPFEARLGGDGSDRPRLEARVRAAGIGERVRFLGLVPGSDVHEEIAWSDVTVSTSTSDGASSSLFESMAVGSAVVVSDIPANLGFVEPGLNGQLFPVGDQRALAEHLRALAEDDTKRHAFVQAARAFAEERLDYSKNMVRITAFVLGAADGGG